MNKQIEHYIHQALINHHQTLSLAESCTGGTLATRFTHLPGCSRYFLGSIVAYSNQLKIKLLNVSELTIEKHGAVSRSVVEEMVQGIMSVTDSNIGMAVTGIAGPDGGTFLKPIGTVWGAIAFKRQQMYVWNWQLSGNREQIIHQATNLLLHRLWELLKK